MIEITIDEIKEKFDKLPEDLKWAIMGANIDDHIIDIGQANQLNVAQMGQLALETYAVILGYTKAEDFEKSVKASLGFEEDKTKLLVSLVNEKVLKPIRENLVTASLEKDKKTKEDSFTMESVQKPESEILLETKLHIENKKLEEKVEGKVVEKDESALKNNTVTNSIPAQRLFNSYKIPSTTTNHSTPNITKQTPSTDSQPTPIKVDPYREIPGE